MFRTFWNEFWYLNAAQRSATLVLLLILVGILCFHYTQNQLIPQNSTNDQIIMQYVDSLEKATSSKKEKQTILTANNLQDTSYKPTQSYFKNTPKIIEKIFVNQIDTTFIHPFLYPKTIARIVKYRTSLGGFYDKIQIKEVYGISDDLYTKLEPHIIVDKASIQTLDLNTQTFKEINKHPYIDYETTKLIVNARKNKKLTLEDLKILLDNELYLKIVPYIHLP